MGTRVAGAAPKEETGAALVGFLGADAEEEAEGMEREEGGRARASQLDPTTQGPWTCTSTPKHTVEW